MSVSGSTVLPRELIRTTRVGETKPPAEEEVQPNPWKDATDEEWQDWRWQLRNRITKAEQLKLLLNLNEEEVAAIDASKGRMATAITPYFVTLMSRTDPNCPIRRQALPTLEEFHVSPHDLLDPCAEDENSPVRSLVHRYPDRVLFLVTDRCASYCRYCTRSRMVSNATGYDFHPDFEQQIAYIRSHPEVRDVLLSGGDPLLLSDEKLEALLGALRAIPHVEFLRIGTRIPIFLPQRITSGLCNVLRRYHPLFISIHSNHPRELTLEARAALERLADAGIPLGNQSVLLRHVNDDPEIMRIHVQKLLMCRVRPYYLYQCDLIAGSSHLRTSVRRGLEIMRQLRGYTTGYAVPTYVIDAPGGGGKVPLTPEYVVSHTADRVLLRNYKGDLYEYPEAPDEVPRAASRRPQCEPQCV